MSNTLNVGSRVRVYCGSGPRAGYDEGTVRRLVQRHIADVDLDGGGIVTIHSDGRGWRDTDTRGPVDVIAH